MNQPNLATKSIKKIAVGIACYKPNVDFFYRQLQSIREQTFADWQCFLCFDSDLAEVRNCAELEIFFSDSRFHFFQNPRQLGFAKNFEQTIKRALESDYAFDAFAFCDQDDIWLPEKLATCAAVLEKAPPLSAVHSDSFLLGNGGLRGPHTTWQNEHRMVENVSLTDLMVQDVATGASMLIDADLVRKHNTIPIPYHDWWYAIVAAACGGLYPVKQALYDYRQHSANVFGAAAYSSFFVDTRMRGSLTEACRKAYLEMNDVVRSTEGELHRFSFVDRFLLGRTLGFGVSLGLFIKGFVALFRNRPLARRCWVRVIGHVFSWFS